MELCGGKMLKCLHFSLQTETLFIKKQKWSGLDKVEID